MWHCTVTNLPTGNSHHSLKKEMMAISVVILSRVKCLDGGILTNSNYNMAVNIKFKYTTRLGVGQGRKWIWDMPKKIIFHHLWRGFFSRFLISIPLPPPLQPMFPKGLFHYDSNNSIMTGAQLTRTRIILALHCLSGRAKRGTILAAKFWAGIGTRAWPHWFPSPTSHCTLCPVTPRRVSSIYYKNKENSQYPV